MPSPPPRSESTAAPSVPFMPMAGEGGPDAGQRERLEHLRSGETEGGPLDLAGIELIGEDLSGLDLMGANLAGANLSRCRLRDTNLFRARLEGAILMEVEASGAEFSGANLAGAHLENANLRNAGLGMAEMTGARLASANLEGATLTQANLAGADLRQANLSHARARATDFSHADLTKANCTEAEFDDSEFTGAVMNNACLRAAGISGVRGFRRASWIGVDLRDIDFTGSYLCRRFILDQNFIEEFRTQSRWTRLAHRIWSLTSDCGRSVTRWTLCTCVLLVAFAWVYTLVGVDYGAHETPLSPLYFSVVTLTTLGYGDVLPASIAAQVVTMCEVVTGYVMLGGLLSIFSNKMARRAE